MQCLYCTGSDTKVVSTAKTGKKVLRERKCQSCRKHFWTEETRDITAQYRIKAELCKIREFNRKKEHNSATGYLAGGNA